MYPLSYELGIGLPFVLAVGTLEPRKNLITLLRAFEQVLRTCPNPLQLVIAGRKGWLVADLFDDLKRSTAAGHIICTGYLSDEELCALYSSCSGFIYPSIYEGFGLPPLEAMACGAPVIASRIASIEEVTGSAARLFPPENVTELRDAILELLGTKRSDEGARIRERLSVTGRRHAAESSWAIGARSTARVYAEAIERFHHRA